MKAERFRVDVEKLQREKPARVQREILCTITEKDFLTTITTIANLCHWKPYHTWNSQHSVKGFPDLVLCKPPRVIFAELKREDGVTSNEQDEWIISLGQCPGVESYLWRPSDLDRISEILNA
jgi:hypothetical protein